MYRIAPEELHIELTYKCNSRCIMCEIWLPGNVLKKEKELTLKELEKLIKTANKLKKIKKVVLSGGEPFLRKDIVKVCSLFIRSYPGISVGILSNLLLNTREITGQIGKILESEPADFWIGSSLDGIGATHDLVRGRKGAFAALVRNVKAIKKHYPKISCSLTYTLTPKNYKDLFKSYKLSKKLGCYFGSQFVVQKKETEKFAWKEEEFKSIEKQVKIIIDCEQENCFSTTPETIFLKNLVNYARKPKRYIDECSLGRNIALLNPYGELYACPINKQKMTIGNIRKTGFDKLWDSAKAESIRRFIDEKKCHCWLYCSTIPAIQKMMREKGSI
ncbi:MAG: hypothetical protein A3J83_03870 [Elusimicrobia bacterium RIFOXYA2_FULL_40_6]|nr:MAG: hypothetical protein A3J83_03870 [Elusimicrobia bacterium RIFOXYA2_FULL_40_6]